MKLERPKLNWLEKLYIPQILEGLGITLRHIPKKRVTLAYPEEKPVLRGPYRGAPTLVKDQEGRVKCVSCQLCEFVCPPKAIRVTPGCRKAEAADAAVEKEPSDFTIDMLRCIYCGMCQEVCPEEAIFLKKNYVMTGYTREEMILHKDRLLEEGGVHQDRIGKWKRC